IDAIGAAAAKHHFMGVTKQGLAAITRTTGNEHGFVILRGGTKGPNYDKESVQAAKKTLTDKGQKQAIMVDCSHGMCPPLLPSSTAWWSLMHLIGNSQKNHNNQPKVAKVVADQLREGEKSIIG